MQDNEPPSPCIDVCRMDDETGLCLGCKRMLDEISHWSSMSAEEKRRVLEALATRSS